MRIIDCKQATPEWWAARRGVPSASNFARIMTPVKRQLSNSRRDYINELIADLHSLTPVNVESYMSREMRNGVDSEPSARRWYQVERDCDVTQVGFCLTDDGRFGCSPDGLVGDDGCLELKCPTLKVQVGYLLNGGVPDEYLCQVHGQLIVTGRAWVDFMSYAPGLPVHLVRVVPDDFTEALRVALDQFWDEFMDAQATFRLIEKRVTEAVGF